MASTTSKLSTRSDPKPGLRKRQSGDHRGPQARAIAIQLLNLSLSTAIGPPAESCLVGCHSLEPYGPHETNSMPHVSRCKHGTVFAPFAIASPKSRSRPLGVGGGGGGPHGTGIPASASQEQSEGCHCEEVPPSTKHAKTSRCH
jgi:hypothetical protein